MKLSSPINPDKFGGNADQQLPRSQRVLLLVDFINPLEFDTASQLAPAAVQAARQTAVLKDELQRKGVQTIYANDNYGAWQSDFRDVHDYCLKAGGAFGEMARHLAPTPQDLTILKPRHSAFLGTPLDLLLQEMHCKQLVIVGLATDICVQLSAMDAYLRGFKLWIPSDCTAAETPERHAASMTYVRDILKADIRPAVAAPRGSGG